jgi:hypothetical protein
MVVSPPLGARGHGPSNPRRKKMFSSHYTSVAKGGGGALLWGAKLYGRVYSNTVTAVLLEYRRASGTCRYRYQRIGTGPVPRYIGRDFSNFVRVSILNYATAV